MNILNRAITLISAQHRELIVHLFADTCILKTFILNTANLLCANDPFVTRSEQQKKKKVKAIGCNPH